MKLVHLAIAGVILTYGCGNAAQDNGSFAQSVARRYGSDCETSAPAPTPALKAQIHRLCTCSEVGIAKSKIEQGDSERLINAAIIKAETVCQEKEYGRGP